MAREPAAVAARRRFMGTTTSTDHRRTGIRWGRRAGAAFVVAVVALTGCSSGDDDAAGDSFADEPAEAADIAAAEESPDSRADANAGDGGLAGGTGLDLGTIGRDVIIELRVTMTSDDVGRTVAAITADAAALGGGIASSDVEYGSDDADGTDGDGSDAHAVLVVKVPPTAVDSMLSRLADTGSVRSVSQSAQDVTDQLVDLETRISNARRSVDSVRGFMERTEDLSELVGLEAELTRRQTDLERLEAQQRNLGDRVALSTITVEVRASAAMPVPTDGDPESIGDALRTGWDAFVTALFTIGFVVAVLLPFLVVAAVVAVGLWLTTRRRNIERRTVPEPEPDAAVAGVDDRRDETADV